MPLSFLSLMENRGSEKSEGKGEEDAAAWTPIRFYPSCGQQRKGESPRKRGEKGGFPELHFFPGKKGRMLDFPPLPPRKDEGRKEGKRKERKKGMKKNPPPIRLFLLASSSYLTKEVRNEGKERGPQGSASLLTFL